MRSARIAGKALFQDAIGSTSVRKTAVPHCPSVFAKEGRMTGVLTGYGHDDIMLRKSEVRGQGA